MIKPEHFEQHTQDYETWFDEHEFVFESVKDAIKLQMMDLPEHYRGIEVGLGTGRYASALGIAEGVESSLSMRIQACIRGVKATNGCGEYLPYQDGQFDFALFTTICNLDNLDRSLKEANRVLKEDGVVIVGFIEKNSVVGRFYSQKNKENTRYANAHFYTVNEVITALRSSGFKQLSFVQTLFGSLGSIQDLQEPVLGFGKGSYVVIRASK